MKNIFIFLMLGILLVSVISIINAYDKELPTICGGDSELLISCLGDQELIFIGGLAPSVTGGGGGGGVPILPTGVNVTIKPEVSPFFSIFPFLGLGEYEIIFDVILAAFLMLIIILVWKRRRDQKRWEREETERKKRRGEER